MSLSPMGVGVWDVPHGVGKHTLRIERVGYEGWMCVANLGTVCVVGHVCWLPVWRRGWDVNKEMVNGVNGGGSALFLYWVI